MNRKTGNPKKSSVGVGMPAHLYLNIFGDLLRSVFGGPAYHVGSSLTGLQWRDVDVRFIMDDAEFDALFGDRPAESFHSSQKWCAMCMAYSALGEKLTGLPIDFQIDRLSDANEKYASKDGHVRSALIMQEHRFAPREPKEKTDEAG